MRDASLDKLKGLAIILVVVGHTIQSLDTDCDNNTIFRVIYSFHMPFFVLLSGAAASFWLNQIEFGYRVKSNLLKIWMRTINSAIYLLVPFVSWTAIYYVTNPIKSSFYGYLWDVFRTVDLSLWFLPVIFWCIAFLIIGMSFLIIFSGIVRVKSQRFTLIYRREYQLFIIFVFWVLIRTHLPKSFGIGMVNFFHGGLFLYFLLGIFLQAKMSTIPKLNLFIPTTLIFVLLVPFWSRIEPHNFTSNVPGYVNSYYIGALFTMTVAATGSISLFLAGNLYLSKLNNLSSKFLLLLGTNTLGIYALHPRFIYLQPYILSTLVLSLATTMILSRIPVVRLILLGKH